MRCKPKNSRTLLEVSSLVAIGCLSIMMFSKVGDSMRAPDTCGDYFFLPMFPECNLFLEAVPCFNNTPTVIITMATPLGDVIHSFKTTFGSETEELDLSHLTARKYEGLVVRSTDDISLYIHKTTGDSMIVFPIDTFARDYEIPRMTSPRVRNSFSNSSSSTDRKINNAALYLFTPYNNTSISFIPINDHTDSTSTSPPSSPTSPTSTTILLDAFAIHKEFIDTRLRYKLHSADVFAVVFIQTVGRFNKNDTLCRDTTMLLIDFVPPYSVRGKYFYLAYPNFTDFTVMITGRQNTSIDIITDVTSREVIVDQSGTCILNVTKTSSAWISASQAVSVYIKVTVCNISSPSSKLCADNGFFLPSVEHYFTCDGNQSQAGCICTCPSVFQRDIDPDTFHIFRNSTGSRPTSIYPLLVGELFDVTTSITHAKGFKDAMDVIVTTNNSFSVFRYDLENLNFLPAGGMLENIYNLCFPGSSNVLFGSCEEKQSTVSHASATESKPESGYSTPDSNQCLCEFVLDSNLFSIGNENANALYKSGPGSSRANIAFGRSGGGIVSWIPDDEDTTRPLIAVVVSLCVSIFAVIALISGYMLVEMMSRRKHVRNTKIRPFVS